MFIITTRRRQRQREDEAWSDGYHCDDADIEDTLGAKDDFIAKQGWIITELMKVVSQSEAWGAVPDDVAEELRSYV